jgi:hypothetical protein
MLLFWLAACRFLETGNVADLRPGIERACKLADRVDQESDVDPARKLTRLIRKVAEEQNDPAVLALLQAIERAPPGMRRKVLDEVLSQNGLAGLNCPSLDRIVGR